VEYDFVIAVFGVEAATGATTIAASAVAIAAAVNGFLKFLMLLLYRGTDERRWDADEKLLRNRNQSSSSDRDV
jgi:hypothetical protein